MVYGNPSAKGGESLILTNGRVITLNASQPQASAIVIRDGRLVAVGDESIVAAYGDISHRLDLAGAWVVPGFIDTHVHFTLTGLGLLAVDLADIADLSVVLARIAAAPGRGLIVASGFQPELNPEHRFPTPAELDAAGSGRPVYVMDRSGHWSAVNAAALALLNLRPDADGLDRNAGGTPTGILRGEANMAAFTGLWQVYKQQVGKQAAFERAGQSALAGGITTLHALDDLEDVEAMLGLDGELPLNIVPYTQTHDVTAVKRLGLRQIGGCGQVALDGDFGPHTAALLEPYTDQPDTCGRLFFSHDDVRGYVEEAHRAGLQVALHCVGSGAIEQLLQAYESVLERYPRAGHRHRIEHFELPAPGQAERAHKLGVLLALQPAFNHFWPHDGEYPQVVGQERAQRMDPVGSVVAREVPIAFGSDSPVTPMRPLLWMHSAVNHSNPGERIGAADALRFSGQAGSYFAFQEDDRGSIEVGKRGDLAILDADPLTTESSRLQDIRVLRTIVGGRVAYEA